LAELKEDEGMSLLFITHDLGIVRKVADRVCVMQHGQIVEQGPTAEIFNAPNHEYTKTLLSAEPTGVPDPVAENAETVLSAENLKVWFPVKTGLLRRTTGHIKAVNDASFEVRDMQMVFQDPYGSLSPRMTVGQIVAEGLGIHGLAEDAQTRVPEILSEVGLEPDMAARYPHEFSGGQRQRIAVARAMILKPKLVVLDEPTSALDMTVQVQIVDLLRELQLKYGLAYLFISHDLKVVRALSHKVMVMRAGDVMEAGTAADIFDNPQSEYTRTLMAAAFDLKTQGENIA